MDQNKLRKGYNGYLLTKWSRDHLLTHVGPVHPKVIAHHITHEFGVYESWPPDADHVRVVAVATNERVQAAIVKVNGIAQRNDGSYYHITISVNPEAGGKPVHSNELIKNTETWQVVGPFNVAVVPQFFPFNAS